MEVFRNPRIHNKEEFWQKHLRAYEISGLSQQEYCKQHSLALSTFGYWRRKIKRSTSDKPRFYPLTIPAAALTECGKNPTIALYLNDDRFRIELEEHFSPLLLKKLVTTLEQL